MKSSTSKRLLYKKRCAKTKYLCKEVKKLWEVAKSSKIKLKVLKQIWRLIGSSLREILESERFCKKEHLKFQNFSWNLKALSEFKISEKN